MNLADLGRRAVACKRWRWMPGMTVLGTTTWRVVERQDLPPYMVCGYDEKSIDDDLPKLDDPATLGCLLALVREAWKEEDMGAFRYDDTRWCVEYTLGERQHRAFYGATEAEALVAALEAAP